MDDRQILIGKMQEFFTSKVYRLYPPVLDRELVTLYLPRSGRSRIYRRAVTDHCAVGNGTNKKHEYTHDISNDCWKMFLRYYAGLVLNPTELYIFDYHYWPMSFGGDRLPGNNIVIGLTAFTVNEYFNLVGKKLVDGLNSGTINSINGFGEFIVSSFEPVLASYREHGINQDKELLSHLQESSEQTSRIFDAATNIPEEEVQPSPPPVGSKGLLTSFRNALKRVFK